MQRTLRQALPGFAVAACGLVAAAVVAAPGHATASVITGLTVRGSSSRPVFTVSGHGLAVPAPNPKISPSNQPLCPLAISGNAGLDYGTAFGLIVWDGQVQDANAQLYAAGRYRPSLNELDCIGIVVLKHTSTRITFTLGHAYTQYYRAKPRLIRAGDVAEVILGRARFATVVRF
jgi:hypothetical protein